MSKCNNSTLNKPRSVPSGTIRFDHVWPPFPKPLPFHKSRKLFFNEYLVGWSPFPLSVKLAISAAASLSAAACYGIAGVYTKVYMQGASSKAVATCSQLGAALFLLPITFVAPSKHSPTPIVVLSVILLALLCTAIAYVIYFWLIEHAGPTRALTVTFLAPVFGVLVFRPAMILRWAPHKRS